MVSDPAGDVYAQGIKIFLPIGAGQPGDLSSSTPSASATPPGGSWAVRKQEGASLEQLQGRSN